MFVPPQRSAQRGEVRPHRSWSVALALLFLASGSSAGRAGKPNPAKDPSKATPWVELQMEALGFPGMSANFLSVGASMFTVHFVDSGHLLVTFGTRGLVPRLEGDPEGDEDRMVAAELVDLPTGKIEAKTEWRMHDHGRYLWSLGEGRFLVRLGQRLFTIDPLGNLAEGKAFQRTVFPGRQSLPSLVLVSPDSGVVTLETTVAIASKPSSVVLGDQDTATSAQPTKTLIDFFRMERQKDGGVEVKPAGAVQSQEPLLLPVDADGYLWATQMDNNKWSVTFDEFGGKTLQVGTIDSTCQPRLQMLDRSEFLAMTCRGRDDRIKMMSYGLDGHETWEESLGDFGSPTFAYAAAAARFAVSHISESALPPTTSMGPDGENAVAHQEVRVYQNASGDLLLKVECVPVFKTAENFDLSADGMLAAVVRGGVISVYRLPELGVHDRQDMAEVAAFAPPATDAPVVLTRLLAPVKSTESDVTVAKGMVAAAAPAQVSDAGKAAVGAQVPVRRPPTLLKPGEKPEFGKANGQDGVVGPQ